MQKTRVVGEKEIKNNILSDLTNFRNNISESEVFYDENFSSNHDYLNYINSYSGDVMGVTAKRILVKEMWELESLGPGMGGDMMRIISSCFNKNNFKFFENQIDIDVFFKEIIVKSFHNNILNFRKEDCLSYVENIGSDLSKEVCKQLLEILDPDDIVFVEETFRNDIILKKQETINLKISFDPDFLLKKSQWSASEYKFIIIDGYIDSVGEIHHLLQKASENKLPYVIFCKGMRDEVKHVIMQNNARKIINVMPVSLDINQENVNILNGIASCHDGIVISALLGDTISKSVRNELNSGNKIEIRHNNLTITAIDDLRVEHHRKVLEEKLKLLDFGDPNIEYLRQRIKNLSAKKLKIQVPNNLREKSSLKIDIDGFLKFLIHGRTGIIYTKNNRYFKRNIYTAAEINILLTKIKNLIKIMCNIGCAIVVED